MKLPFSAPSEDSPREGHTVGQTEGNRAAGGEVADTLAARGARYGTFATQARYAEVMNIIFLASPNWETMSPDSKEALRIIANKIGRILNGDPEYDDNWRDIAGYATLVLNRINGKIQ